ncbi:MAG: RNA polymerase sigma factor [Clostridia bacterium]|nr:RNA polymerase sigma factor [Clostridia bacterium]
MDDSSIVELYLRRNEDAVRQSAEKYGRRLRMLSYGIVCDHETAEECENDTYLQAWNAIPPHEPKTYLYAFLARITRHLSLNACRSRDRLKRSAFICELSDELETCIAKPDDAACRMTDEDLRGILSTFLSSLPEKKRNIFLRRYWYLDSIADISKRFGLSESSVKTTLFRCRAQLRQALEKEGYSL